MKRNVCLLSNLTLRIVSISHKNLFAPKILPTLSMEKLKTEIWKILLSSETTPMGAAMEFEKPVDCTTNVTTV